MTNKKILILGYKQHGKDKFAELLRDNHGLNFRSSSLFLAEKVVRPKLEKLGITYASVEDCYADRDNHRIAWRDAILEHNQEDPAKLAKAILEVADCYVGMRSDYEYQVAKKLFDRIIWVDGTGRVLPNGRVLEAYDESLDIEFNPDEMLLIENKGTIQELGHKAATVAEIMGMQRITQAA